MASENDSNDSVGRRRGRAPVLYLGDYYGTAGKQGTLDDDGLTSGDQITLNGLEYLQIGNPEETGLYSSTPYALNTFGGARFVRNDPTYGYVVPVALNQQLVNKANAMSGDAVFSALDQGAGFWALAGAFATAVVAPSILGGVNTFVAAEAGAITEAGAVTEGAVNLGVSMDDVFLDNWDLLRDPTITYQTPEIYNVGVGGGEVFVDNWDLLKDPTVQYQAPEVFNSPLSSGVPQFKLPTIPGQSSALTSLLKALGGGSPTPARPGTVIRPGANNFVFLPGGAPAGGAYFPAGGIGGGVSGTDSTSSTLFLVAAGLGLLFVLRS